MTKTTSSSAVAGYYDAFLQEQKKTGINARHRIILYKTKNAGFKKHHQILEIGCGIGILSSELAKYANKGMVTGVDISPESIAFAAERWKSISNLTFIASDIRDLTLHEKFDLIILPDVLEHIPLEFHDIAFEKLASFLKPDGRLIVHIPSGAYNQYIIDFEPEKLQIIDLPLRASDVIGPAEKAGLELLEYSQYCLHVLEGDYVWMVFRSKQRLTEITRLTGVKLYLLEFVSRWKHFMFKHI
jgi:trans-aconitate 2-methyltransferase